MCVLLFMCLKTAFIEWSMVEIRILLWEEGQKKKKIISGYFTKWSKTTGICTQIIIIIYSSEYRFSFSVNIYTYIFVCAKHEIVF